ncbi:MAG: hypothetical protein M5R40_26220 [Anaerolineae bacterium]|nr:hypothetical protein [Anaerolineae bacterium]
MTTAPVLVRSGRYLYVYARGADDNLYRATKFGADPWGPWSALVSDGSVKGRISVTITQNPDVPFVDEHHIVFRSDNGTKYVRFIGPGFVATHDWLGASEGVIEGDGSSEVVVALNFQERVVLEVRQRTSNWNVDSTRSLSRDVHEMSNLVRFGEEYHLVVAEERLADDVSSRPEFRLLHAWFEPPSRQVEARIIDDYVPQASNHAEPSLLLYRNKLLTAWSEPDGDLRAARWDNADPEKPWIAEGSLGSGGSDFRPALTAFDYRGFIPSSPASLFGLSNYGNDAMAAVAGKEADGQIEFIIMSRALMRDDISREFDLYNSQSDTLNPVCRTPDEASGPIRVTNLWQEERPILTEIGFNLWAFPDWFVRGLYADFTDFMCGPQGEWGASNTPCLRNRLPVYVKAMGGLFNCRGAWINHDNTYIRVWEELGHYMGPALGIGTAMSPTQETSDRTGIPLSVLQAGYDLFGEGLSDCNTPAPRCRGFTGIGGNYDAQGREHSFIYTVYYYLSDGDAIRLFIQEDLAAGNNLLQRKYNWVRDVIFRGVEFRGDLEPF